MKTALLICLIALAHIAAQAQGPRGKEFGFGIVLGEPTGATVKYWTNKQNALIGSIGGTAFGSLRIQGDYVWHFNAFSSDIVKLYIGPGLGVGFGSGGFGLFYKKGRESWYYREDGSAVILGRMVLGANIIPRRSPLEIFVELAPVIGFVPAVGFGVEAAVGLRFYP